MHLTLVRYSLLMLLLLFCVPAWAAESTQVDAPAAPVSAAPSAVEAGQASAPAASVPAAPSAVEAGQPPAPAPAAPVKGKLTLEQAIQLEMDKGTIDPAAQPGFLGIPGAPAISPVIAFLWAIWVGWIFSTVGAFGGVMAGVGHMSVFGFGAYAESFGGQSPLNKGITDSIRVSNQWLVGVSALVSSIKYASIGRIVLPLGIALGIGSLAGSTLIPRLTQGMVSFKGYQGYFGLFVLGLGCYLLYETTSFAQAKRKKAAAAAKAFEAACKLSAKGDSKPSTGVSIKSITPMRVSFTFCGVDFSFSTILPIVGGFIISSLAAFLGVGGGFLLVPFLTSITQLPMYLAAGTSAFAVLIGMVTAITTFMAGGTTVDWGLVGFEICGIVAGSWIGPMTAKFFPDIWLKRLFIVLAFVVGLQYTLKAFFQTSLW